MAADQPPPRDGRPGGEPPDEPDTEDAANAAEERAGATNGQADTMDEQAGAAGGQADTADERADTTDDTTDERPDTTTGADADEPAGRGDGAGGTSQPEGRQEAEKRGQQEPKTGRRLPLAVGVGLGLGAAVLLSLYPFRWPFLILLVIFVGIAIGELNRALLVRGVRIPILPVTLGLLATAVAAWTWGPPGLIAAFAFTVVATMVWRLPDGVHGYVRDMTAGVFAAAYLPLLAGFAVLMLAPEDGNKRIIIFIAVTISSDIGGYFVGAFLGRHRMAPAISPKKTWEGLAGSVAMCMLVGSLLVTTLLQGAWWQGLILGAAAAATATFGDLSVSMIKRDLGIKDMGGLIPEHGGVLDRLDSLLATAPVVWLLLTWIAGEV